MGNENKNCVAEEQKKRNRRAKLTALPIIARMCVIRLKDKSPNTKKRR